MSGIQLIEFGEDPTRDNFVYNGCPLCEAMLPNRLGTITSYQMPGTHPVFACNTCKSHFSIVNAGFESIYEKIYRQRSEMPGYARYDSMATNILSQKNPLTWLADQEDVYWGIAEAVKAEAARQQVRSLKIVDIGCGLGYLTYALRCAGHDCTGLDISVEAITSAKAKFGPHYAVATIDSYSSQTQSLPDIIIMAELIEHIVDPLNSLRECVRCLSPSGSIIITTPNLDAYSAPTMWVSDPPPVHLWLFSERSLRIIADKLDCEVSFVDFNPLNRFSFLPREAGHLSAPAVRPGLDSSGRPVQTKERIGILSQVARLIGIRGTINCLRAWIQDAFIPSSRRPVMCCILNRRSRPSEKVLKPA